MFHVEHLEECSMWNISPIWSTRQTQMYPLKSHLEVPPILYRSRNNIISLRSLLYILITKAGQVEYHTVRSNHQHVHINYEPFNSTSIYKRQVDTAALQDWCMYQSRPAPGNTLCILVLWKPEKHIHLPLSSSTPAEPSRCLHTVPS